MKAILNKKREIVSVSEFADKSLDFIETDFDFGRGNYDDLYKDTVPLYYLDINNEIKKRTYDEIKSRPEYKEFIDRQQRVEFSCVDGTDAEFIRSCRELLKVESIRSLLSSDTQQRLANAELKVEQIKEKYEIKE